VFFMTKDLITQRNREHWEEERAAYWSPYVAGAGIGITLLLAYWFLGTGLGASGALARLAAYFWHGIASGHVGASAYFGQWFTPGAGHVLSYYLIFMAAGIFAGGLISALGSGRIEPMIERGPQMHARGRLILAFAGGMLVGFASRLARGCTSGQALSGTALLLTGSVVFLVCLFIGGYATALLVRREWL
jgi:uncharacterized membrane protein YedE/YeeE